LKSPAADVARRHERDYLLRIDVSLYLKSCVVAALIAGFCGAQRADEIGTYLPPGKPTAAASEEVSKLIRLIRQGSGPDRNRFRQELMRLGGEAVPRLLEELEGGNQIFSWNAALILGELRDPRSLHPLCRVASEQARGDSLASSLALGRLEDPAALGALIVQILSGKSRESRRAAAFALGRLQRPEATAKVVEVARESKQELDTVACLVALGMTGDGSVRGELAARVKSVDDRVRRAACIGLALLPRSDEAEQIALARLADEDDIVRLAALGALARIASAETASGLAGDHALVKHSDARIRAAAVLVIAARGGPDLDPFLAKCLEDPSERVRAAAVAGLAAAERPHGEIVARSGLGDSEHALVRLCSVITLAVIAGRRGQSLDVSSLIEDRDAGVRDAALVAHAWRNGAAAKPALRAVVEAKREDRLVRRAKEILQTLEASAELSQRLLRAELQVLLDDSGGAPSWNVHKLANEQILFALGLENALPDYGGGGGSEERSRAAAARRVPPRLEDLRRHLDVFPYSDIRDQLEVPILRSGGVPR
jgi:HEAT repeat protein